MSFLVSFAVLFCCVSFCLLEIPGLVWVDRKKMSFSVEHPPVQVHLKENISSGEYPDNSTRYLHGVHDIISIEHSFPQLTTHLMPVREKQVEVLEGLPQEEGLHHVPRPCVQRVPHVADGSVAS